MQKKPVYYEDRKGEKPVKVFIDKLGEYAKGKILARIQFLGEHWHELKRPYVDYLGYKIYELRVHVAKHNIRIIYAFMFKDYIVLLHGIVKKTSRVPEDDKTKALRRMNDFQAQLDEGSIKLQ
jgi:phage-related protein